MRRAAAVLFTTAVCSGFVAADDGPPADALDDALATAGIRRADLGWRARGTWERYPMDVPYKLRHFDDACARVLSIPPYVRAMGASVRTLLDPAKIDAKGELGAGALYRAAHDLGVNKRFGATRPYSAGVKGTPAPLDAAILAAIRDAGRPTRFVTFGKESPYPLPEKEIAAAVAPLPAEVSAALGRLVGDLVDAGAGARLAFRNVPLELRVAVSERLDMGAEIVDALDYPPEFDDVARLWDEASLWTSGLKVVEALDLARAALLPLVAKAGDSLESFRLDVPTPNGRVIVLGTGDDEMDVGSEGAWLVVDLGGNDRFRGRVAASSPSRPVAALLDLGGDDAYEATDRAQGSGVTGIGVLLDAGGKDRYEAKGALAQGAAQFGLGALIDVGGDDVYAAHHEAQGAAFFGVGLLLDLAGTDAYAIRADGQGYGGCGGVGVLADRSGDDRYEAFVDPAVSGRPSYHSDLKVSASNAQGCGMGRRGDGSDGHSWAGGLGALLDAEGNDRYLAGNWCQGVGYWFGTGLLWDGTGNDEYDGNGWSSGAGAHFCIGALVDESGDDLHRTRQNWGPCFGHDFTAAVLVDLAGNDRYECGDSGISHSINRSVALLVDAGGDDAYVFTKPERRPATAPFDARYLDRTGSSLYWTEPRSAAVFVDVGGKDEYPPASVSNDSDWSEEPGSDNRRARNHAIGIDRGAGTVDLDRPE